jgi:uncharacterized BrkB/YihY/UPF0761 family membrane protein
MMVTLSSTGCGRPPRQNGRRSLHSGGLRVTELAKRVVQEVREDNCLGQAAQLAYYLIFAVFPFLLFLATLLGYLPIPNLMDRILESLAQILPGEAVTLLQENIRQLVTDQKGGCYLWDLPRSGLRQCGDGHHGRAELGV